VDPLVETEKMAEIKGLEGTGTGRDRDWKGQTEKSPLRIRNPIALTQWWLFRLSLQSPATQMNLSPNFLTVI